MNYRRFAYFCLALFLAILVGDSYYETHKQDYAASGELVRLAALASSFSTESSQLGEQTKTGDCRIRGPLPDPECTPGAVFPDATVEIICVSGYSKKVRNVSVGLKKKVYESYGISYPQERGSYEMDHLIPLAIGGNNESANLFPEAVDPTPGFREKDVVEAYLREKVCDGSIDLAAAQKMVAEDWVAVYEMIDPVTVKEIRQRYKNWSN